MSIDIMEAERLMALQRLQGWTVGQSSNANDFTHANLDPSQTVELPAYTSGEELKFPPAQMPYVGDTGPDRWSTAMQMMDERFDRLLKLMRLNNFEVQYVMGTKPDDPVTLAAYGDWLMERGLA